MKLSIIVPFHNEERNVPLVLDAYARFWEPYEFELICVNDGSKDTTRDVFEKLLKTKRYPFVRCVDITPEEHIGYGHAIMTGVHAATGDVVAWTHSDMQTDPADVFRAFERYQSARNEKTIIKGRRVARPLPQVVFSFGMAVISSVVLRKIFFEINAQPKLFSRHFVQYLENAPGDFSLDLYLLYQAKIHGYRIESIPVLFTKRLYGVSSWAFSWKSKVKTIRRTLNYITKLRSQLRGNGSTQHV